MPATSYDSWLASLGPGGETTSAPWAPYAGSTNLFMQKQAISPFMLNLPNYAPNVFQRSQNTNQMLQGNVPEDVLRNIQTAGAERGIVGGSAGSPNANAAWLRALGLTSLDLMKQGSEEFSKEIADTPTAALTNPANLYIPQYNAQQELAQTRAGQTGNPSGSNWGANRISTNYSNYLGIF